MTEWSNIVRRRRMYERKYSAAIKRSLMLQIAPVIKLLETQKPEDIEVRLDESPISMTFGRLYSDTGVAFARVTYQEVTGKSRKADLEDVWMQEMIAFIREFGGVKIKSITGTSRDIAQRILRDLAETVVIPEGLGIEETSRLLQRSFKRNYVQTTLARARVIAQTEVLTASNKGSHVGAEEAGAKVKIWQTSGIADPDGKDRHVGYVGLHGQERAMLDKYDVGGYLADFPGDPNLPAGEVVNCKCVETYRII